MNLRSIVESFPHSKFEPSFIWRYPHVQTIIGTGALKAKYFGPLVRTFEVETCERFETPDGDFFDVEFTKGFSDSRDDKSVIILHGLESNSKGNLVTSFATAFVKKGFSCCLFNFRSCSGVENRYALVFFYTPSSSALTFLFTPYHSFAVHQELTILDSPRMSINW